MPQKGNNVYWKKQILEAIDRCEKDVEALVKRNAPPEEIEKRRKNIGILWKWYEAAEA